MPEGLLGDVLIVDLDVLQEGLFEVVGGIEAGGGQHLADAAVEALDHAVGLGVTGFDETVVDVVFGTDLIEGVCSGRLPFAGGTEAIGEFFAVVGEHLGDLKGRLLDQAIEETLGGGGRLVREQFYVDPSGGPVDGGEQVAALRFVGHLREVLDVHVDETGQGVLERLVGLVCGFLLELQGIEAGHPMTAQATGQAGTGNLGVDELMGHRQQVVQGQQERLTQRHDHGLLGRAEGGVQRMGAMRAILRPFPPAPLGHGVAIETIGFGQLLVGHRGRLCL